jgi:POT family proton-dependent oligopeptide transporter
VLIGAIVLCFGHGVLAFEGIPSFFTGLGLIILGVGLLKPNISTMVGGLYAKNDIRRDKAFSIFYVGINLGSLLATIIVVWIKEEFGWHAAFGTAGIAMVLGLILFILGKKHLEDVGNFEITKSEDGQGDDVSIAQLFKDLFKSSLPTIVFISLLIISVVSAYLMDAKDAWGYGALFVFISFVVGLLMSIYRSLENKVEKDRFIVLLLSFILVIVFWGAFEQAGGLMTIFTKEKTDLVVLGITLAPEMIQSLNAGFILLLAVPIANIWAKRKLKSKEASSLFKMAIGTVIMGLGFVFMVFAVKEYDADGRSSLIWLVLAYLFHTVGELCSSPVALSFITKLAPVKYGSLMMGVYFAATGLGGKVAGIIGESSEHLGEYTIFIGITVFTVVFATIVILLLKPLKRLTHGAEDIEITEEHPDDHDIALEA